MRDTIAFEESCSLSGNHPDEQNRRLKAATLENTFYQLDRWINDSVLKLVFAVFVELKMDPIQKLRDLCENGSRQDEIDSQIEKIDELFERIVQIGSFALSFSWDFKSESHSEYSTDQRMIFCLIFLAKSNLRSSLASLESLDSFLIPAILSHSKVHSNLLQSHWNDEIVVLINSIQNIIDSQAFCGCIIDILSTSINNLSHSFDKDIISNLILHCDVLSQHFEINFNDLSLGVAGSPRSLHFDDFHLMIKECKAALVLCKADEENRIIKRLKILLSVLKKLHASLKAEDEQKTDKVLMFGDVTVPSIKLPSNKNSAKSGSMEVLLGATVTTEISFESMGIVASPTRKVLYESKREKSIGHRGSPKIVDSTFKVRKRDEDISVLLTPSRKVNKSMQILKIFHFRHLYSSSHYFII